MYRTSDCQTCCLEFLDFGVVVYVVCAAGVEQEPVASPTTQQIDQLVAVAVASRAAGVLLNCTQQ